MANTKAKFGSGTAVESKEYGEGVILSVETVELPSDGDHTFYRVQMDDGTVRNLKGSDLTGGKKSD